MTDITKPPRKPARPYFSSGPCAKPPGYSPQKLATESLGRSHRAKIGKARLAHCIDLMREVLESSSDRTQALAYFVGSVDESEAEVLRRLLDARSV